MSYLKDEMDLSDFNNITKQLIAFKLTTLKHAAKSDPMYQTMAEMDNNIFKVIAEYALGRIVRCCYNEGTNGHCKEDILVLNLHMSQMSKYHSYNTTCELKKCLDDTNPDQNRKYYWRVHYSFRYSSLILEDTVICAKHRKFAKFCSYNSCWLLIFGKLTRCACGKRSVCSRHETCKLCGKMTCGMGGPDHTGTCCNRKCNGCGKIGCIACVKMIFYSSIGDNWTPTRYHNAAYCCSSCDAESVRFQAKQEYERRYENISEIIC